MEKALNIIALKAFDILAGRKGFAFKREQYLRTFPGTPGEKKGVTNFVAYYKGKLVGTASLVDLSLVGRAYSTYAVDEAGKFFEIQDLQVDSTDAGDERFITLGLFRQMYSWSRANAVTYWHCNGARDVYMALRRYSKEIRKISIDFESARNPLNQFLVTKRIQEAWFGMDVNNLAPWTIFKKFVVSRLAGFSTGYTRLLQGAHSSKHKWSFGAL